MMARPTLGYGPDAEHEIINILCIERRPTPLVEGVHMTLNAISRTAVRNSQAAAVQHGGASDGEPGLRHYGQGYFATFVVCSDSWKLEAVCQGVEASDEAERTEEPARDGNHLCWALVPAVTYQVWGKLIA
ncbi:hypothetical protein CMQ_43 [Grosmannia clavigera kw1407]|uniref:Uncharacterized protein n=1 Tax=Grosmannia clavigera (strain kw1407 / UAMH 11150) TaxID=655863 RepID=F0XRK4_GROCL|nr:uncharacterized protein CMQ_43 [Grosmannia clavigera kw1407]EFW99725.1 hypothetical protein CMQ_43 [Grosmannia clavigera kw1407]